MRRDILDVTINAKCTRNIADGDGKSEKKGKVSLYTKTTSLINYGMRKGFETMKHYLITNSIESINLKDKNIKNKEVLNLIEERDEIKLGTQVVVDISVSGDYVLEVVKIERDGGKVWWQVRRS